MVFLVRKGSLGEGITAGQGVINVLGDMASRKSPTPNISLSPTPLPPSPTIAENAVSFIDIPEERLEGDTATYTWTVTGPPKTFHTTTVYYGTVSTPGLLTTAAAPGDLRYTQALPDFMQGDFQVPFVFVGNAANMPPGTFFFRAYALIDGKHYWTSEHSFTVKEVQKNTVQIVSPPGTVAPGSTVSFTWDVTGPSATFSYTAIVASKESKPGLLNGSVPLTQTPYIVKINDFTNGSYAVPFRFIGNAKFEEPGTYYYRALAQINGKNIWSDEQSFTVQ